MPAILEAVPPSHRDLLDAPLTATLTTVDARGRPQSTAVWYTVVDGRLVLSITSDRQKYKNLQANPSCSLLVLDPQNPFRTLEVRAEADATPDPDKVTVRTLAQVYGVDPEMIINPAEDRHTVTLRPRRVVANPPSAG